MCACLVSRCTVSVSMLGVEMYFQCVHACVEMYSVCACLVLRCTVTSVSVSMLGVEMYCQCVHAQC